MRKIDSIYELSKIEKLNIIHIDMDAFYAAVEEQDNPSLKGKPVIVGGTKDYGVVTTANYHARKYGVHSAMPAFIARQKCPQGCFVPTRMSRYQQVSRQVFEILYEITDMVEPLSIDEAFLDISNIPENPLDIAKKIRYMVKKKTGLTMSIGISYNKFLAKLASDWNKPNGLKIITKDMIPEILLPLPVNSVYGIGKVSSQRLNNIGIYTIEDLMRLSEEFLMEFFGKSGKEVYDRIRGIDHRPVNTHRERKSLGVERTFSQGTKERKTLVEYLYAFSEEIALSLEKKGIQGKTITLKIRDENFRTQTRSKTLENYISSVDEIFEIGVFLLDEVQLVENLRLIGLTISNLISLKLEQLSLFD